MTRNNPPRQDGWSGDKYFRMVLIAVSVYTVAVSVALYVFEWLPSVVRVPLALPILLFAPGYAVVTAVFPNTRDPVSGSFREAFSNGKQSGIELSVLERCTVAVFTSVIVVAVVAFVANVLVGIRAGPVLGGIAVVTVIASGVGILREPDSPEGGNFGRALNRFHPKDWIRELRRGITPIAILLIVVLLALSGMYLVADASADSPATEFYMLEGNDSQEDFEAGSIRAYRLRVTQHSDVPQNYTLVVIQGENRSELQQGSNVTRRLSVTVPRGSTIETTYEANVSESNGSTVWFLLYRGDAPHSPTPESAHRTLRVYINETESPAAADRSARASRTPVPESKQLIRVESTRPYRSEVASSTV